MYSYGIQLHLSYSALFVIWMDCGSSIDLDCIYTQSPCCTSSKILLSKVFGIVQALDAVFAIQFSFRLELPVFFTRILPVNLVS